MAIEILIKYYVLYFTLLQGRIQDLSWEGAPTPQKEAPT